jgi:hypothetical protein
MGSLKQDIPFYFVRSKFCKGFLFLFFKEKDYVSKQGLLINNIVKSRLNYTRSVYFCYTLVPSFEKRKAYVTNEIVRMGYLHSFEEFPSKF